MAGHSTDLEGPGPPLATPLKKTRRLNISLGSEVCYFIICLLCPHYARSLPIMPALRSIRLWHANDASNYAGIISACLDVTLFTSVICKEDCLSLQADLDAMFRWCHLWQMKLHSSKCKVLCIFNKHSLPKFDYKIKHDVLLKCCSSVNYLGVYINSKLSWNDHCSANTAKAMRVLNISNLSGCSASTKFRIFRVLVLPTLEYAKQV